MKIVISQDILLKKLNTIDGIELLIKLIISGLIYMNVLNSCKGSYERYYRYDVWWRWGELNPRPKTFSQEVYMLSKGLLS